MNWFYESGGQQQGPVSESELDRLIANGTITASSLVWREGMADWQPLRTVRPTVPPVPPAIPAHAGTEVPPGFVRCTATGRIIPESDAVFIGGQPYARDARPGGSTAPNFPSRHEAVLGDDASRNGPAWEQRGELGFVRAIGETISGVLLQPGVTFRQMRRTGGIGNPLLYFLAVGYICSAVALFYQAYFENLSPGLSRVAGATATSTETSPAIEFVAGLVALLFVLPLGAFIQSGILHVGLMIFGGARKGYETTFRVCCYVSGSVSVFYLLPMCGQFIAGVWGIVASIIGLAAAHETDAGRAAGAVFLPMILCCAAVIAVVIFFGAMIGPLNGALHSQ